MSNTFTEMTARIVSAYLRGNSVPSAAVPDVINSVYGAISQAEAIKEEAVEPSAPAVPVRSSVRPDYIVCLECGQKAKILRRHLESRHGLTAEAYREKWRLPKSYPLVAPNYAERRSELAKAFGLGRDGQSPAPAPATIKKARGGRAPSEPQTQAAAEKVPTTKRGDKAGRGA